MNEPTAAALAYGLHKQKRGKVAVYDFGGGTFDISILKLISTDEGDIYQVLSTNGDTHLGGDDIDNALLALARAEIRKQFSVDLSAHPESVQELRKALIRAKHDLSSATKDIDPIFAAQTASSTRAKSHCANSTNSSSQSSPARWSRCARRWPTPSSPQKTWTKSCWSAARRAFRWSAKPSAIISAARRTAS